MVTISRIRIFQFIIESLLTEMHNMETSMPEPEQWRRMLIRVNDLHGLMLVSSDPEDLDVVGYRKTIPVDPSPSGRKLSVTGVPRRTTKGEKK